MAINARTRVVVQREVTVSTEWTLADLAQATGEALEDVIQSFRDRAGAEWIRLYHVAELVPDVAGDDLDEDHWTVKVKD